MALKVCAESGCPELTNASRCATHTRERDRSRGTRQQRGYDADYDRQRRNYQSLMDAGHRFTCWRCDELGVPHVVDPNDWHLGHDNDDRSIVRGPQCATSNLDTSAQRAR